MSWTHSIMHDAGVLPFWTCDSCTAMKDKTCRLLTDIRGALSRGQVSVPEKGPQFPAQAKALEPIFSQVENVCRWSSKNQQGKPDAA